MSEVGSDSWYHYAYVTDETLELLIAVPAKGFCLSLINYSLTNSPCVTLSKSMTSLSLFCQTEKPKQIAGYMGFPGSSVDKETACNAGEPGLIPESGRSAGEWIDSILQYSWASLVAQLVKNQPVILET